MNTPDENIASPPAGNEEDSLTLLLSGGGFRATLFHLGLIRYLREANQLDRVKEVFSISGGSIAAAHLASRWDDYTGSEKQFDAAAADLVEFTQRGVREEIVRKYLLVGILPATCIAGLASYLWFFFDWSISAWITLVGLSVLSCLLFWILERLFRPINSLQSGYRALFQKKDISSISANSPRFFFLATNLTTGNICCFTNKGIYFDLEESKSTDAQVLIPSTATKFSECVAASSAFPPLFSPFPLDFKKLKVDENVAVGIHYLTDGGVYDNLGFRACRLLSENAQSVLVSDAERRFDSSTGANFRTLVSRASRATDVLMHRVNGLEFELVERDSESIGPLRKDFKDVKLARLQVDFEETAGNGLSADLKRRIRRIRTDLDSFSDVEVQSLFAAGFIAAKVAYDGEPTMGEGVTFGEMGLPNGTDEGRWLPIKQLPRWTKDQTIKHLDLSEASGTKLCNPASWAVWLGLLSVIVFLLVNPLAVSWFHKMSWQPSDFSASKVYSLRDDFPSQYATFVDSVDGVKTPEGKSFGFFILESDSLKRHTLLCFSPKSFSLRVNSPEKYEIFFDQAYVAFEQSKTMRKATSLSDSEASFLIANPTPECKVVVLLGVASSEELNSISPTDFQFVTGDPNEKEN